MKVDLIDYMGDDLMVVNSARVSFNKESTWSEELCEKDQKLIKYLATHGHWTPFSHPQITVRVKAPIFVARQLFKHKVGMTENEVSRRYVDDAPEFYYPESWRGRPTGGAKQGSDGIIYSEWMDPDYEALVEYATDFYNLLLEHKVAPEQARMVLPQSMYTEWIWTGSLASFARIYNLRSDPHAQMETQEVAKMLDAHIQPLFPVSWKALTEPKV